MPKSRHPLARSLVAGAKLAALTVVHFASFAAAAAYLLPPTPVEPSEAGQFRAAGALGAVCLLNSAVLAWVASRSKLSRGQSTLAIFAVFFGTATVMTQIESAVFVTRLPPGFLSALVATGAVVAAVVSVAAVVLFGGRSGSPRGAARPAARTTLLALAALLAAAYVVIYFVFGYYVAWKVPEVRAYYGGSDPGTFLRQMASVQAETPWLVPFQFGRGLVWTALALLLVHTVRGGARTNALTVGLAFSVWTADQLLLPNAYMPETVRMAHLVETGASNLLFGVLAGFALTSGSRAKSRR